MTYENFWQLLIAKITDPTHPFYQWDHEKVSENHITAAYGGIGGVYWKLHLNHYDFPATVELYILKDDPEDAERMYLTIEKHRTEIESYYGTMLKWNESKRGDEGAIRVIYYPIEYWGRFEDAKAWDGLQYEMIEKMKRLKNVLTPYIETLRNA